MNRPAVFIDRRVSGLLGAFAILVILGVGAWFIALCVISGYLPPKNEGVFGVVKSIFCLWLIIWVIVAVIVYALEKVVLWIEIGDQIIYRNLLGVRTLPWPLVARFEMIARAELPFWVDPEGRVVEFITKTVLGIKGELQITTTDGNMLEIRIKSTEWTLLKELEVERRAASNVKPIRLSIGRAIGFFAGGLAALAVWLYTVYLICSGSGELRPLLQRVFHDPKAWISSAAFVTLWPIGGCAACIYGARHLFRRHRTSAQGRI